MLASASVWLDSRERMGSEAPLVSRLDRLSSSYYYVVSCSWASSGGMVCVRHSWGTVSKGLAWMERGAQERMKEPFVVFVRLALENVSLPPLLKIVK